MISERPDKADNDHQVLPFRPRKRKEHASRWQQPADKPSVNDFRKYEGDEAEDSYRHRMLVNLAALLATIALALAGAWLVAQMADLRKKQDCVLSGRRNCMPITDRVLNH